VPLFYFNIRRGEAVHQDPDGTQLETPEQARNEAVQMLSDMAREEFPRDGDHQRIGVEVYDAFGRCVARAAISLDLDRMDSPGRTQDAGAGADK
jgi:hypothetical protein